MCCWKLHWFIQLFCCKICSLWLQNFITQLKLWPAFQQSRPSLNWLIVLSWVNRAQMIFFLFLMFHHKITKSCSSAMWYDCIHSGFNWRQRRKQNSVVTNHLEPPEQISHAFLLVYLLISILFPKEKKRKKLSSLNVSKFAALSCSSFNIYIIAIAQSQGQKIIWENTFGFGFEHHSEPFERVHCTLIQYIFLYL